MERKNKKEIRRTQAESWVLRIFFNAWNTEFNRMLRQASYFIWCAALL